MELWVWLVDVVVKRYIYRERERDFLILLIPTPLVSALFCSSIHTFCSFFYLCFSFLFRYFFVIKFYVINNFCAQYKHIRATTSVLQQPYEGLHIMFYTQRSPHKRTIRIL